jgi:hypothetical protein
MAGNSPNCTVSNMLVGVTIVSPSGVNCQRPRYLLNVAHRSIRVTALANRVAASSDTSSYDGLEASLSWHISPSRRHVKQRRGRPILKLQASCLRGIARRGVVSCPTLQRRVIRVHTWETTPLSNSNHFFGRHQFRGFHSLAVVW